MNERVCRDRAYDADIILLQETWLCNATSFRLNDALKDYTVYHTSSVEDKFVTGVYTGRPFGGTAVLVHKKLCSHSCRVVTDNSRLTAVRCQLKADNDIIIGSVYMPFNDNSRQNHDDFLSVVGVMQGVIDKHYSCSFIFGGDFNTSKLTLNSTQGLLSNVCDKNSLLWLDPGHSSIDYTYHNGSLGSYSLIDYFLCSPKLLDSTVCNHWTMVRTCLTIWQLCVILCAME